MFTGIIQTTGEVRARVQHRSDARFEFSCGFASLELGESIAVDGVCLTVESIGSNGFTAHASAETLSRTTLAERRVGDGVNLERALAVGDRLGGHIVTGHVDGVGTLTHRHREGDSERVTFTAPREVLRFLASKGSVAIDGVSLTVNGLDAQSFDVMIVPFTLRATTLGAHTPGRRVNLEVDVLARYVARALSVTQPDRETVTSTGDDAMMALLQRQGWIQK